MIGGLRRGYRRVTAAARVLPDFIIIGAARCGTTSLHANLSSHPDVLRTDKEIHFFDNHFGRGTGWYRSFFPTAPTRDLLRQIRHRAVVTGEASPYYLFHPMAAERAASVVPDARIVVLLRDPVTRAHSEYRQRVSIGWEHLSFLDALRAEDERLAGWHERLQRGESFATQTPHQKFSYAARGRYAEQLRRWFRHYPRASFKILRTEDLGSHPTDGVAVVLRFLGVEPGPLPAFPLLNRQTYPAIEPACRDFLIERFEEPNRELEELLGRGFTEGWSG